MNKKRILLCAYSYPPLMTPHSIRWFYFTKELCERGYSIDVVTIRMPERFREFLDLIPEEIKMHRTYPGPFYAMTYHFSREPSLPGTAADGYNPSPLWSRLSRINSGVNKALNFLLVPDSYAEWLPFALKRGISILKKNRYDLLISTSEPRVGHLLGYLLKKKFSLPWIADYGDPWIYPISPLYAESRMKRKILFYTEKKILPFMDNIILASRGMKRLYLHTYPFLDRSRLHIIPQGYDPDSFPRVQDTPPHKFRIVYCGSFYRNLRNPMNFLHAIQDLDREDIEVVIAGRINEFALELKKARYRKLVSYRGYLNHLAALALQKSATVLLHIGTASDIQVPGKLYEYFGAGRPVLCIQGGENDFSVELMEHHRKGLVVHNTREDIREAILSLYGLWKEGLLDRSYNLEGVDDFTWRRGAEQIIRIVEGS